MTEPRTDSGAFEVIPAIDLLGGQAVRLTQGRYDEATVSRIVALEEANRYKRRLMLVARISNSAINLDREIPRD